MERVGSGLDRRALVTRALGAAALFSCLFLIRMPADPGIRLCPFYWLTGLPCPLCGFTRAVFELAKGHFHTAIALNAASPFGFAMLFSLFWKGPAQSRIWTAGLAAFAIFGVSRILFIAV